MLFDYFFSYPQSALGSYDDGHQGDYKPQRALQLSHSIGIGLPHLLGGSMEIPRLACPEVDNLCNVSKGENRVCDAIFLYAHAHQVAQHTEADDNGQTGEIHLPIAIITKPNTADNTVPKPNLCQRSESQR